MVGTLHLLGACLSSHNKKGGNHPIAALLLPSARLSHRVIDLLRRLDERLGERRSIGRDVFHARLEE